MVKLRSSKLWLCSAALAWSATTVAQAPQPLVCSITINSDDEIKVFRRHLGDTFRFVELTEGYDPGDQQWFDKACKRDLQCDVLVISGHFAGMFFGTGDFRLPLEKLEEQACSVSSNRCAGILSRPREVFLFGCNTLRRPEFTDASLSFDALYRRYTRAGYDPSLAVRLATTVKTGLFQSFGDRMRSVFTGAGALHGFSRAAPLGHEIAPALDRYFESVPDYARHLQESAKNARLGNRRLASALRPYSFAQMPPVAPGSAAAIEYANVCRLYDRSTPVKAGLTLIDQLLGGKQPFSYQKAYEQFAGNRLNNDMRPIRNLKNAERAHKVLANAARKVGDSIPYASIQYANIASAMGWIDDGARAEIVKAAVLKLVNWRTDASIVMAQQIRDARLLPPAVKVSTIDLPADFPELAHVVTVLGWLDAGARDAIDQMIECLAECSDTFIPLTQALARMSLDARQIDAVLDKLSSEPRDEVQAGIIFLLSHHRCANSRIRNALLDMARRDQLQPVALEQMEWTLAQLERRCD